MLAGVVALAGSLAGCVAGGGSGDDSDPACQGKCDGASPDAGMTPDGDIAPADASALGGGSVTIDGALHTFATGHVRTGPYSSGSIWSLSLDNWSYGSWGAHVDGIDITILKLGTSLAGTYPCGLSGPDAWKVAVEYYTRSNLIGTDIYGGACSVTIGTTPTTVGERVDFTFDATLIDGQTTTHYVVGGTGSAILVQ